MPAGLIGLDDHRPQRKNRSGGRRRYAYPRIYGPREEAPAPPSEA